MIKGVIIKKINKYEDERGWLAEIFREDEVDFHVSMSYISSTKPGVIRGPHEHKYQSDFFVFIGPGDFELHLWDRRENSETYKEYIKITVGESNLCSVVVPLGVVHGYKCVSDNNALCVNMPNKLYKGKNKQEEIDEIRWEQDKNSPYKIL
ncbi:dTDP-4-dehydrorhamnose 3,5-epimerase family protein [Candidatus Parcubacteria bacterium]|nr:dTDP-4-dehydrorhamnose 3,5-epimerase family protein [Candidatus Parcubacteria bacterium]